MLVKGESATEVPWLYDHHQAIPVPTFPAISTEAPVEASTHQKPRFTLKPKEGSGSQVLSYPAQVHPKSQSVGGTQESQELEGPSVHHQVGHLVKFLGLKPQF